MALVIDATAGGASSNSNALLAEAESYHEARLHNEAWTGATTSKKNAALVWATSILDNAFDWMGGKASTTQALRWPRSGVIDVEGYSVASDAIPQFLIDATAEMAMYLLEEDKTISESGLEGFAKIKVSSVELVASQVTKKRTIPESVLAIISHYGSEILQTGQVSLVRC